ncbi:hypothetical protein [Campylobacter sp. 7477a]|uniref:hypothetical protein n=1 Tax=Campylobacter sp. 7477a TaxID=2735741 RepID=UPI0030144D0C|nr:hypothetical protein [Campylobacter sp. 7477a]
MTITLTNVNSDFLNIIKALLVVNKEVELFKYDEPNDATLKAFDECNEIIKNPKNHKGYHNVGELFRDVLNERK